MTLATGTQVGRYEIRSQIGAGGMGEVYLAEDSELRRTVAIKILPEALASNQQRLRRFVQEAKAASALNHPHILTIYEIGTIESLRFIVTEFIDGDTLRERIMAGMKLTDILEIAIQATSALAAAHAAGIIHRDIKPENIMVRRDGYIKLLDFGLAKLTAPEGSTTDPEGPTRSMVNTSEGTVIGTANYMSPEQAKGTHIDERTDLWSLGAVIYEMTTGHVPFPGETSTEVISLILQKEAAPLTRFARDVPAELERIVRKSLSKDCEERYQSAKDVLIDLRNLKRKLEVDAEIERTAPPELRSTMSTGSERSAPATASPIAAASSASVAPVTASSVEYLVSNIKRHKLTTIIALFVIAAGLVGSGLYLHKRNTDLAIDSIAVLPFVNQNADPDSEYLSDGVTESIINNLTQLPTLRVIPSSSAFHYKGKEIDPLTAGKELGVRAILTGRILQRGDDLTISAALVDVRENKQLWGEQYNEKASDLLSVQREIARQITGGLRLKLTGEQQSRIARRLTDNPEAYQLYLKGRFYWNKRTSESLRKSVDCFNEAIAKDPSFALAYSGLADAYGLLSGFGAASPQESLPQANAAARKAVELDDTLAETHTSLGLAYTVNWAWSDATKEFQRAIELNPNYATAHHWYSDGPLLAEGRFDEAIAEMKRAQELDPLSLIIHTEVGMIYIYARQYDKAIEPLQKTIEMDQTFYFAHLNLAVAYHMKGAVQEALEEYQIAYKLNDDPTVLGFLGHFQATSGKRNEALKTLSQMTEISQHRYVPAYSLAQVYAGLGERDQAFQWLEKSYQDHATDLVLIKVDPTLDNLHSDSRFADLVRRVGLRY